MMTTISLKYHLVQPPFYGHYTGQLVLDGTSSSELEDFFGAKFYCPHARADGNQRIWIRENITYSFNKKHDKAQLQVPYHNE